MDNRRLKREGKKKQSYSLEDRHWIPSTLEDRHWIPSTLDFFSWSRIGESSPRCVLAQCPAVKLVVSLCPGPMALLDRSHMGTCSGKIVRYSRAIHPRELENRTGQWEFTTI
jgi:hypothetical protein